MNQMQTITVKSIINGASYQYIDDGDPKSGTAKNVYFSPDRTYVVAIFKTTQDYNQLDRLKRITTLQLDRIKKMDGGDYYLDEIYRWPTDVIDANGKTGIIVPIYKSNYFFVKGYASQDLIKGNEKNGKWFASAKFRNKNFGLCLDKSELGNWLSYFQIGVNIARGVKKLHQMGLAHSDLSYNNVLIDPVSKAAVIIDLDGMVVPGVHPAEVIGTADFIAPEVLTTKHLHINDANRKLPNIKTDLHAFACLIYMLLLHRHPLKGGKINDLDSEKDDLLSMGEKALFIEHPTDKSNRPKMAQVSKWETYWADVEKLPYTITGPYLTALFNRAFIDGLHNPMNRPTADEWETALLKTTDLMQPCSNVNCDQKWYVFDNTNSPRCPFCSTNHQGTLPVLDFYFNAGNNNWRLENHRLMVYNNQYLFQWHVNRNITRNEKLSAEQKKPVGYFTFHNNKWVLVNQTLTSLIDKTEDKEIPINTMVELTHGKQLVLSKEDGGRVVVITLANQ
jgi:serine/threonine protein kinase